MVGKRIINIIYLYPYISKQKSRRALQAAVEEVRAARLARLEALPRRVGLGVVALVVGTAIEAVRDAMRRAARDNLTAAAREDLLRLVEARLRYLEARSPCSTTV